MTLVTADKVIRALSAGGINLGDPLTIQRVIIDLRPGYLPTIHVQHMGHDTVLRIVESVDPGGWCIIADQAITMTMPEELQTPAPGRPYWGYPDPA